MPGFKDKPCIICKDMFSPTAGRQVKCPKCRDIPLPESAKTGKQDAPAAAQKKAPAKKQVTKKAATVKKSKVTVASDEIAAAMFSLGIIKKQVDITLKILSKG